MWAAGLRFRRGMLQGHGIMAFVRALQIANSWAHAPFDDHRIGATVQYLRCKTGGAKMCKAHQSTSLQSQDLQQRSQSPRFI
eukprot:s1355_g4.t1